jgi:protein-S-isoprenylcysteine O-methyltransferase Ste14
VVGLPKVLQRFDFAGREVVGWIAVGIATVAFGITWVCWIKMGKSWRMGIDPNEKTQLIFNGPYAYVRHPIYGLSQVLMLSTLAAWPTPLMLVLAALHLFLMQWEVRREDKYLVQLHGPAYAEYMKHVGRFVPRITPWK